MKLTEDQYAEIVRRQQRKPDPVAGLRNLVNPSAHSREVKRRATRRKYGNTPTVVDGHQFDSKREAERFEELKLLEGAGEIRDLRIQVRYPLVVNGQEICLYVADFVYQQRRNGDASAWDLVVVDVKSPATMTDTFRIKRKLMKAIHNIELEIVT